MERNELAEGVIVEYHRLKREPQDSLETSIIDLMTDLMHLANRESLNALALSKTVQMHFQAEQQNEPDRLRAARVILAQMGGIERLKAMIGARNFTGGENYATFHFPGSNIANFIRVTLNALDTYDVEFFKVREHAFKKIGEHGMIYCDQLVDLFESTTGLVI